MHADIQNDELIYTNSYYYIGHFSKFIKPAAKRIICSLNRDILQVTGFVNTDGSIVVIVLNTTDSKLKYKLWMNSKAVTIKSLAHSIQTIIIK